MEASNFEDAGWLKVMEVATLTFLSMAARAAVLLNVPHILAEHAGGEGQAEYLSPSQIASHFDPPLASTTTLEQASISLDRILRVLACHGLLSSSTLLTSPHGLPTRTYALNSFSRYLLQNESQTSLAPMLLFQQDPDSVLALCHLHEAVLDGSTPFSKAHGLPCVWPFLETHPNLSLLFNQALVNYSNPFIRTLLETYHGFDDVTSLVDVGGGHGVCLQMITSKHPHIKGINFDRAHVVESAPPYPGVEHVGGDMFDKIPQASAVFMKGILHDWSDAHCSKLLENCYRALPKKGKVIVVTVILPAQVDCEQNSRVRNNMDLIMFTFTQGGKERTLREIDTIAKASGFSRLQVICTINGNSVVEIYKEPLPRVA